MPESNSQKDSENGKSVESTSEQIVRKDKMEFSGDELLSAVLATQCSITGAQRGVILRLSADSKVAIAAAYPKLEISGNPERWIKYALQFTAEVLQSQASVAKPLRKEDDLYGQPASKCVLLSPFRLDKERQSVVVFLLDKTDQQTIAFIINRLEDSFKLLRLADTLSGQQKTALSLERLSKAMWVLSEVNREYKFNGAAMALCNSVTAEWACERASVGFIEDKYVKLKAMSHTEHYLRKMQLVQNLESAMEECVDQDIEIIFPAPEGSTYLSRAAQVLSTQHGPVNILSLPLRKDETVQAVLTLERPPDKPFSTEEIETLRLVCELCSPRLIDLYENDRLIPFIAVEKWRLYLRSLSSPRHTFTKVTVVAIFIALIIIVFGRGTYRSQSSFIIESTSLRVIPAPFDGFIKSVEVEPDDVVEANETILAQLDTAELRLQLVQAQADKISYDKQAAAAMRDNETAQAQIAQANADKAEAQINLLYYQIGQASLTSPIRGTVVKGDLKKQIGAPVKTGDVLFEVAPLGSLRAELMIPEDQIFDIKVGQKGSLATFSHPSQQIKFEVERINPVAEVINQRNIFKVRVRLIDSYSWLRPGMEGVAKVNVGKRPFIWIWTRKVINWLRMKLWI